MQKFDFNDITAKRKMKKINITIAAYSYVSFVTQKFNRNFFLFNHYNCRLIKAQISIKYLCYKKSEELAIMTF